MSYDKLGSHQNYISFNRKYEHRVCKYIASLKSCRSFNFLCQIQVSVLQELWQISSNRQCKFLCGKNYASCLYR